MYSFIYVKLTKITVNGWKRINFEIANSIKIASKASASAFNEMATSAKNWSNGFNIINGVLSIIVGSSGIASITQNGATWANIVTLVIGWLIAIFALIVSTFKFNENQLQYSYLFGMFMSLANDIEIELTKTHTSHDETTESDFMQQIQFKYNQLKLLGVPDNALYSKFRRDEIEADKLTAIYRSPSAPDAMNVLMRRMNSVEPHIRDNESTNISMV